MNIPDDLRLVLPWPAGEYGPLGNMAPRRRSARASVHTAMERSDQVPQNALMLSSRAFVTRPFKAGAMRVQRRSGAEETPQVSSERLLNCFIYGVHFFSRITKHAHIARNALSGVVNLN